MSRKPNTKPYDKLIAAGERKLAALQNGEWWPLTAGERARLVAHGVRGSQRVVRSKSPTRAEAACERVFEQAIERADADVRAAKKARKKLIDDAADQRLVARRESKWW